LRIAGLGAGAVFGLEEAAFDGSVQQVEFLP
jgi:hypothetical protein